MTVNKNNIHNGAKMEKNDKNNHKITLVYRKRCRFCQPNWAVKYNIMSPDTSLLLFLFWLLM